MDCCDIIALPMDLVACSCDRTNRYDSRSWSCVDRTSWRFDIDQRRNPSYARLKDPVVDGRGATPCYRDHVAECVWVKSKLQDALEGRQVINSQSLLTAMTGCYERSNRSMKAPQCLRTARTDREGLLGILLTRCSGNARRSLRKSCLSLRTRGNPCHFCQQLSPSTDLSTINVRPAQ